MISARETGVGVQPQAIGGLRRNKVPSPLLGRQNGCRYLNRRALSNNKFPEGSVRSQRFVEMDESEKI